MWPPRSPELTPFDFFLWGYVQEEVHSVRSEFPGWTQSTDHCTNCKSYKGQVTARLARGRMYARLQMALNLALQTTRSYLFSFLSLRCLKSRHSSWYTLHWLLRKIYDSRCGFQFFKIRFLGEIHLGSPLQANVSITSWNKLLIVYPIYLSVHMEL